MSLSQRVGGSRAALLPVVLASAMLGGLFPALPAATAGATPFIQKVDCAVGAHIGPLGACILGSDPQPGPTVVERPPSDAPLPPSSGCTSTSVNRTDAMGNSETKTRTDC